MLLTKRDHVDDEDSVLEGSELEVHKLDEGPDHPVLSKSIGVGRLNLLLRVGALHDGHVVEEDKQVAGSENSLVEADTGEDLGIRLAWDADAVLEETKPLGSERSEDGWRQSISSYLGFYIGDQVDT